MKFSQSSRCLNVHKSTKEDNWFLSLIFGAKNINTQEQITENKIGNTSNLQAPNQALAFHLLLLTD